MNIDHVLFLQPIELWTGKQLFSVLVRPNVCTKVFQTLTVEDKIYMKLKQRDKKAITVLEETMCPNDGFVYFRNSELLCGQVGKKTLGEKTSDGFAKNAFNKLILISDFMIHIKNHCLGLEG